MDQAPSSVPYQPENPLSFPDTQTMPLYQPLNMKKVFFGGLLLFISLVISLAVYRTRNAPNVQAQEYLTSVGRSLYLVQDKLDYYLKGFTDIKNSVDTSRTAFYEITTNRDYFSAQTDTQADIAEISTTLEILYTALEEKQQLEVPAVLADFDIQLTKYYSDSITALELLLKHEQFQKQMLDTSGDELNQGLKEIDTLFNQPETAVSYDELLQIIADTAQLAQISARKFANLDPVPEIDGIYYELMNDYHQDLALTLTKMAVFLRQGDDTSLEQLAQEMLAFSQRTKERERRRENDARILVENSSLQRQFEALNGQEQALDQAFEQLLLIHQVNLPSTTPAPTITVTPNSTPLPLLNTINFTIELLDNWNQKLIIVDRQETLHVTRNTSDAPAELADWRSTEFYIGSDMVYSTSGTIGANSTGYRSTTPFQILGQTYTAETAIGTNNNQEISTSFQVNLDNQYPTITGTYYSAQELEEIGQILSTFEFVETNQEIGVNQPANTQTSTHVNKSIGYQFQYSSRFDEDPVKCGRAEFSEDVVSLHGCDNLIVQIETIQTNDTDPQTWWSQQTTDPYYQRPISCYKAETTNQIYSLYDPQEVILTLPTPVLHLIGIRNDIEDSNLETCGLSPANIILLEHKGSLLKITYTFAKEATDILSTFTLTN